jgi:hypothetical protein
MDQRFSLPNETRPIPHENVTILTRIKTVHSSIHNIVGDNYCSNALSFFRTHRQIISSENF